nr:putative acyl-activating enzyme 19 isoform X1 [Ipomoea batatas]GMC71868.1 putative acyl-activating enzyme 19 isoform X1 [Ipomoea batatas]GME17885.1 putative acyl-activating enzyme 19 isoform X1 [Ipomoea batatas]
MRALPPLCFSFSAFFHSAPTVVRCGTHDHNLYALDYRNYCCIFKIPCGGSVFGSPAVDESERTKRRGKK